MKYQFIAASSNRKTGPIPQTYTSRESCPPSCPQYRGACYAEGFHTRLVWDKVPDRGLDLEGLTAKIKQLATGQIWRFAVAGDLPGEGEQVDAYALGQIVKANRGKKGFTYTHKKSPDALQWARHATQWGFTVNISADDAGEADRYAAQGLPTVCIVPMDTPKHTTTPEGRPILVCPAQTTDYMTCALCQLCQKADRRQIIGFRAHGTRARIADQKARRVIPIYKEQTCAAQ
jgi:hypothetical protein